MTAKKLIAIHLVQFAMAGKMVEVLAGQPLVLEDEKQIEHLFNAGAVRDATTKEVEKLFNDETPKPDGKPLGISADLTELTKADLVALAAEKGVVVGEKSTKADLVKAIEGKTEAAASDELL